jgi:hypothetical protein
LEVPATDELVLLTCRVAPGLAGNLVGVFYRNASVHLDVRYRSGLEQRWRTVRPSLESGAIVSHLPLRLDGLRELFETGPGETDRAAFVQLHTAEPWQFDEVLQVQWWALPLRAAQRPWRSEERPPEPVAAAWSLLGEDCSEDGMPAVRLEGEPRPGAPIEFVVEGVPPGSTVRILIGVGGVELRRKWSTLFVDPERMLTFAQPVDEAGFARLRFTIPPWARLAGLEVTFQAARENAPRTLPAWELGCGLQLVIGS